MRARSRIIRLFEVWAATVFRHPWLLIVLSALIVVGLANQVDSLRTETSTDSLLHPDDPVLRDYDAFRHRFGGDERIFISVEPREIFDLAFLKRLRELHDALEEEVPLLVEVISLINVRETRGEGDELIVGELLEDLPSDESEMAALKERVLANPLYVDGVISHDGRVASLIIEYEVYTEEAVGDVLDGFEQGDTPPSQAPREFLSGEELHRIVTAVKAVTARFEDESMRIHIAGNPVFTDGLQALMRRDMVVFMGTELLVIAVLLSLLFRRLSGVLLPLTTVVLSLIGTMGLMALVDIPISIPTQILPSFLIAVGVGYSVHLLVVFFQRFDASGDREASLVHALGHSGLAIVMTALTTVVGLLSFTSAEILPIAQFGVVSPIGVGLALYFSLVFLPAVLAVTPMRPKPKQVPAREGFGRNWIVACGVYSSRNPRKVVIASAGIVALSLYSITGIRYSHAPATWLAEESEIRMAIEAIDDDFGGSTTMEIVIESGEAGRFKDPDALNRLKRAHETIRGYHEPGVLEIGKIGSLLPIVLETHQALNENQRSFYTIPQQPELLAQELLLFENSGSDDLEDFVDSQFSLARLTVRAKRGDALLALPFVRDLKPSLEAFMGDGFEVEITGTMAMMTRTMDAVIKSMTRSYAIALACITPLMMLLIGSLRDGLVSMVPNLAPILLTLGLMAALDMPVDTFNLLTGCIAIGLAVDDTIHFIHGFQRYYAQTRDAEEAVRMSLETTGKALLFTSIVLATGFFIYMLSSVGNLSNFGLITGFAISVALIADVTVTPALLVLVSRTRSLEDQDS